MFEFAISLSDNWINCLWILWVFGETLFNSTPVLDRHFPPLLLNSDSFDRWRWRKTSGSPRTRHPDIWSFYPYIIIVLLLAQRWDRHCKCCPKTGPQPKQMLIQFRACGHVLCAPNSPKTTTQLITISPNCPTIGIPLVRLRPFRTWPARLVSDAAEGRELCQHRVVGVGVGWGELRWPVVADETHI